MTRLTLAQQTATTYHQGQFRKKNNLPYIVHPQAVVRILKNYGVKDSETLAMAWLHDTIEDTPLTSDKIKETFGDEVAKGVYVLTRNVNRDDYKQRLLRADKKVQIVKLADMLDNVSGLDALSVGGVVRKIREGLDFYVPLAMEICPSLGQKLLKRITGYLRESQINAYSAAYDHYLV